MALGKWSARIRKVLLRTLKLIQCSGEEMRFCDICLIRGHPLIPKPHLHLQFN